MFRDAISIGRRKIRIIGEHNKRIFVRSVLSRTSVAIDIQRFVYRPGNGMFFIDPIRLT
jgi:hypothetical protein